jgi:hypothetical protein
MKLTSEPAVQTSRRCRVTPPSVTGVCPMTDTSTSRPDASAIVPYPNGDAADSLERLPRCCPTHPDWPTLAAHLLAEFPEVHIADIVRDVASARQAVADLGLDEIEQLATGEIVVRHQLLVRSGRREDLARLDPETHRPR